MNRRPEFLENSLVVGAHPDDELLWFTSILKDVDKAVIVFRDFWAVPGIGEARAQAIANHPHPNVVCLDIDEPGSYGCANWSKAELTDRGIAFSIKSAPRTIKRQVKRALASVAPVQMTTCPRNPLEWYEANYDLIRERIRPHLAPGMNVFTHNPWGEYGHEDHIQVFRVLEHLRDEIGFKLWMSNYCTERTLPLAMRHFSTTPASYFRLAADKDYAASVAKVYQDANCWTWPDDWVWFEEECFIEAPKASGDAVAHGRLMPMNLFTIGDRQPGDWGRVAAGLTLISAGIGIALADAI